MRNYIYKLKFTTPVHFGINSLANSTPTCLADTLFSAICIRWIEIFNNLDELIESVNKNEFLLSDTFPYIDKDFYIPKPVIYLEKKYEGESKVDKKEMKSINYIPINKLEEYISFLVNGGDLPFKSNLKYCQEELIRKASILRKPQELEDGNIKNTEIYNISVYRFLDNCGIYFILRCKEEIKQKIDIAMDSLSMSGLGGKRSLGYGKFEFESYESDYFDELLDIKADYYMALTTFLPTSEEIKAFDKNKSTYILVERGGFVESLEYSGSNDRASKKKKPLVMFGAGSCFDMKFEGQLFNVSKDNKKHPVYKYGKPLFLGVKI